ncbi:MAG: STAS domain-containing protein [Leptospiraceae bacterium]|nr:STAS domain-containing protein [Leptospiraceae bacterium]
MNKQENQVLLKVIGDILMENSKDFYNGVRDIIDRVDNLNSLCFDFSKVQFMDSSGIGSLIKLTSELKKESCSISMYNLNKNLKAVFQLSGISGIINVKTPDDFQKDFPDHAN